VLAALFVPPLIARMRSEEALLAKHFGAASEAYRARTWRLIRYVYGRADRLVVRCELERDPAPCRQDP
jgi:hypothetical protein